MKRYGNLYEKIYDLDNLILAHKHASTGKGWYQEVKQVNQNPEEYLKLLQGLLINKTYETSEYTIFLRKDGVKVRMIYKLPYFPDRICQWAIMQVIEPILISQFIRDTYSAIPGRGIHLALDRITKAMRTDPKGTAYCLKMDVKKFYPSIDHDILKAKFRKIFKDQDLLWLLDEIIGSTPKEEGIPIGNYLSQYCGNYYLSEFDHWIKETTFIFKGKPVKIKYYYRYMDDMVILSDSKEFLHYLRKLISEYLYTNLKLVLKNSWQVFPTKDRGIDYIGYRIFPDYILLRKRTVKTLEKSLVYIRHKIEQGEELTYHDYCSVNSYLGWVKPCDSYRLKRKYIEPIMPYVNMYYYKYLCNDKKEDDIVKQFLNVESTVKKEQSWADELYTYVLLKQEETTFHSGEDDETPGWISSYIQYTHEEFQDLITKDLKKQVLTQLDQSLDTVKSNKITESKVLLEKYYKDNPLFSKVHKESGEYYAVTSDKQSYLLSMIALCDQSKELGIEFTPTWNATGEQCEPWTETELKTLALQIAQCVYPAVSKQQSYEKQIEQMTDVEQIQNLVIVYGDSNTQKESSD